MNDKPESIRIFYNSIDASEVDVDEKDYAVLTFNKNGTFSFYAKSYVVINRERIEENIDIKDADFGDNLTSYSLRIENRKHPQSPIMKLRFYTKELERLSRLIEEEHDWEERKASNKRAKELESVFDL